MPSRLAHTLCLTTLTQHTPTIVGKQRREKQQAAEHRRGEQARKKQEQEEPAKKRSSRAGEEQPPKEHAAVPAPRKQPLAIMAWADKDYQVREDPEDPTPPLAEHCPVAVAEPEVGVAGAEEAAAALTPPLGEPCPSAVAEQSDEDDEVREERTTPIGLSG